MSSNWVPNWKQLLCRIFYCIESQKSQLKAMPDMPRQCPQPKTHTAPSQSNWFDHIWTYWDPHRSFRVFFLYLLHPSGRVSKSTIFTNHNLISVRHRKYRLIILLYLHVISCSSTLSLASSRDPEPRPSLESSNHSSLDLVSASIGEPEPGFDEVLFSVLVLCIQVFLTVMWGGTLHRYKGQTMCKTRFESQEMTLNGFWKIMLI